jgi:ubiquinone/menaquinone biosynthesis C-methylase UbiE
MKKELKDFNFSKRAASYDAGMEGKMSRRFYDLLGREVKPAAGMRLLDVGCGTGALLKRLSGGGNFEAHGIDVSANMIAVAKQQCPACSFRQASCEDIPFPNGYFDILTACLAYHHFADKAGFAREAARVLKPGGMLYIADPKYPYVVRKCLNGVFRLFRVAGEFFIAQEIADRFSAYGFELTGTVNDGYVQVVKLKRRRGV